MEQAKPFKVFAFSLGFTYHQPGCDYSNSLGGFPKGPQTTLIHSTDE
jgi:hypothetical protein